MPSLGLEPHPRDRVGRSLQDGEDAGAQVIGARIRWLHRGEALHDRRGGRLRGFQLRRDRGAQEPVLPGEVSGKDRGASL